MAAERRAAVSGWCLCFDHERCVWSQCACSCHVIGPMSAEFEDGGE